MIRASSSSSSIDSSKHKEVVSDTSWIHHANKTLYSFVHNVFSSGKMVGRAIGATGLACFSAAATSACLQETPSSSPVTPGIMGLICLATIIVIASLDSHPQEVEAKDQDSEKEEIVDSQCEENLPDLLRCIGNAELILEEQLAEVREQNEKLAQQLKDAQTMLCKQGEEIEKQQAETHTLSEEKATLAEKEANWSKEEKTLKTQRDEALKQNEELSQRQNELQEALNKQTQQANEQQTQYTALLLENKELIDQLIHRNSELVSQHEGQTVKLQKINDEKEFLKDRVESAEEELQQSQQKNQQEKQELRSQITKQNADIKMLKKSLKEEKEKTAEWEKMKIELKDLFSHEEDAKQLMSMSAGKFFEEVLRVDVFPAGQRLMQ